MPYIETADLVRWLDKAFMLGREAPSDLVADFFYDYTDQALKIQKLYLTAVGDPPDLALRRIGPDGAGPLTDRQDMRRVQPGQNIGTVYWQAFGAENDDTPVGGFTGRNAQIYCRAVGEQTPTTSGGEVIVCTTPAGTDTPVDRIRITADGVLDLGGLAWRIEAGWYELAVLTPGGTQLWMRIAPA